MSAIFWFASVVMAVIAFSFVALPIIRNNRKIELVGIAVAMPALAAGLYWFVGSPQAMVHDVTSTRPAQVSSNVTKEPGKAVGSVASMIDGLADRLQQNPDDGKSWLLLARSYKHLQRIKEAEDAYAKAVALGEYDEELAAVSVSVAVESSAAQIFGNLQLSAKSAELVLPTDTVFIFARAVDGPPMPVAVLQRPVSDLPLDFLLNDSQAMSPDARLSNYEQVTVTARISRSGVGTDALQDLEARSDVIDVAEYRHLNLIIE